MSGLFQGNRAMSEAFQILLNDAQVAALDRYIVDQGCALSRENALAAIVANWADHQRSRPDEVDEGLRPDELNASNDL